MSALRLVNVWNDLADAWSEEAQADADSAPNTGVFARRPLRDSYTHARPLLAAVFDFHAEDLTDISSSHEAEGTREIHLRPTLRP